jgi:hypothetical protein
MLRQCSWVKKFYSPKPHNEPRKLEKFSKKSDSKKNMQQIKFQELALFFLYSRSLNFLIGVFKM